MLDVVFPKGGVLSTSALWLEETAKNPRLLGCGSDTTLDPKWRPVSTRVGVCGVEVGVWDGTKVDSNDPAIGTASPLSGEPWSGDVSVGAKDLGVGT